MIGSAYNLAMEQKLVTRNPTQGCALPKVEHKEMKTLTSDQLSTFFQEARDSGVYELYYLDLATGLRRGELLGLKWTDVDLDRGVLKIQRAISRQNGKVVEAPLKMEMSRNVQSGNTQNLKSSVAPVRLPAAPASTPGTSQAVAQAGCVYRP